MKHLPMLTLGAILLFGAQSASALTFSDNFDVDTSASWNVNKSSFNQANNIATFAKDYSIYGIASAPGSSGGSTRGLMLEANIAGGISTSPLSGFSVSPIGLSVTTDFIMTADVWLNYVGPGPGGGNGTTQLAGIGFGTAGTTAQYSASAQDSVHFSTTLDGGSGSDYRAYSSAAPTSYASGNAVYASPGGTINNSGAYYTGAFPAVALPGSQNGFTTQTGTTAAGSTGFKWRQWKVQRIGNLLSYRIDGLLIATVDTNTVTLGGSNILINMFDSNASSTTTTSRLNFMLVDNLTVVPEPSSIAAIGVGLFALARRRKA
ncbi:MAG: PEP-CTERM sorting domain-containing protein [Armatimonadetes bacterium]|nr:PEP-CTERM sorting domain-containing protein [Armatimonadota bacterium]